MLRSAKTAYFNGLISSMGTKPGKFWRHFWCLSRHTKGVNGNTQLSVTANDFNNHFLAIPYKTVVNVTSTVPATEFLDRLFVNRVVPPLEFSFIDSETVSSVVSGLDFHAHHRGYLGMTVHWRYTEAMQSSNCLWVFAY